MARADTLEKAEKKVEARKIASGVPECNRFQEWVDSLGPTWSGVVVAMAMGVIVIGVLLLIKTVFPGFMAG